MNPTADCCGRYSMWRSRIYSTENGDQIEEKLLFGEQLLICNNGMYSDTETTERSYWVMHNKREDKNPHAMQGNDLNVYYVFYANVSAL